MRGSYRCTFSKCVIYYWPQVLFGTVEAAYNDTIFTCMKTFRLCCDASDSSPVTTTVLISHVISGFQSPVEKNSPKVRIQIDVSGGCQFPARGNFLYGSEGVTECDTSSRVHENTGVVLKR